MVNIDSYGLAGLCVACVALGCLLQCCIDLYLIRRLEAVVKEAGIHVPD